MTILRATNVVHDTFLLHHAHNNKQPFDFQARRGGDEKGPTTNILYEDQYERHSTVCLKISKSYVRPWSLYHTRL